MDYFDILLAKKLSGGGGGGEITVEGLTVNDNGTYTAPSGKAYSPVVVNLPLSEKAITANGEYNASADDLKGYSKVTVAVEGFKVKDMPTGAISSFDDGTENPLKELKVSIVPVQSGSGDPSPSNPRAISGWTGANIYVTGINIWDEEWEVGGINSLGNNTPASDRIRSKNYISCKPNTSYYLKYLLATNEIRLSYYDVNKTFISQSNWLYNGAFTAPTNAYYFRLHTSGVYGATYNYDISINYPSTDTDYHSYNGQTYTIQLGDTYYGGELDVTSGVLTVKYAIIDLGTRTWNKYSDAKPFFYTDISNIKQVGISEVANILCTEYKTITHAEVYNLQATGIAQYYNAYRVSLYDPNYTDENALKTALSGVYLVYELLESAYTTVQLTPTQVSSILGTNNLWADSGEVLEGEYFVAL